MKNDQFNKRIQQVDIEYAPKGITRLSMKQI